MRNGETWDYSRSNRHNCQTSLNFICPHFLTRMGFCRQRLISYFSWAKTRCPLLFRKKKTPVPESDQMWPSYIKNKYRSCSLSRADINGSKDKLKLKTREYNQKTKYEKADTWKNFVRTACSSTLNRLVYLVLCLTCQCKKSSNCGYKPFQTLVNEGAQIAYTFIYLYISSHS